MSVFDKRIMRFLHVSMLVAFFCVSSAEEQEEEEATLLLLDSMVNMMLGSGQYDREYYSELRNCMGAMDSKLPEGSDGAWQGMIDYWDMRGGIGDIWGEDSTNYMEYNVTISNVHNMTIYEPCDYTSNVAYYHPVTEICFRNASLRGFQLQLDFIESFVRGFSNLAMGSSFMHGSNTHLGSQQDNRNLGALAYQIHQASLSSLPRSPVLHDLDQSLRSKTVFELISEFRDMFINIPVNEWYDHTETLDIPNYYLTYSAIFTTTLDIAFQNDTVDKLIPFLANLFGVPSEYVDFIKNDYLPVLRVYTSQLNLGQVEKLRFRANGLGTAFKLIYAFLWQERVLTDNDVLKSPKANEIGWELLPVFNTFLNQFITFPYYEDAFQLGQDIYPGDFNCNPVIPHAKWHLQSAIGMLDLAYLADEIHKILSEVTEH